jgi:outer membrane protein OmpA-like peptidoglycan-associated protein
MKFTIIVFLYAFLSYAQSQPLKSASTEELIEKLAEPYSNSRSLTPRNLSIQPRSVDMMIQFEFDSSKIKTESKPILDSLAGALKNDRLKDMPFLVEGHTDAKGTAAYNQALSVRRADAIVDYLTQQGIEPQRLKANGKGFSELLLTDKPFAMENRRVRVSTIPQ